MRPRPWRRVSARRRLRPPRRRRGTYESSDSPWSNLPFRSQRTPAGLGYSRAPASGITSEPEGLSLCEHTLHSSPGFAVTFSVAMVRRRRHEDSAGPDVTELAALADGSLAPERRAALEAQVAASLELTDRLAEQQRGVALTRSAADGVEAPAALRARIEAQRRLRRVRVPRRPVLIGAAATAVVAVAVGLAIFSSGA